MKFLFQAIVPLLALLVAILNWLHPYNPVKNSPLHREEVKERNQGQPIPSKPELKPVVKNPGPTPSPLAYSNYTELMTGIEFVCLPKGCYKMGCGAWNDECYEDEKPVHEVCLDAFCIGKHEVTQGQWKRVMVDNPSGFKQGDDYPVEMVSWDDVIIFIKRLNTITGGNQFRLPTESEWEYACRSAGQMEAYPGSSEIDAVAWYNKNSGSITHPVNTKEANKIGVFNFAGNVREWCSDIYSKEAYVSHKHNNPVNTKGGLEHVVRGGCWYYDAKIARCSNRYSYPTDRRRTDLGFRLVKNQ